MFKCRYMCAAKIYYYCWRRAEKICCYFFCFFCSFFFLFFCAKSKRAVVATFVSKFNINGGISNIKKFFDMKQSRISSGGKSRRRYSKAGVAPVSTAPRLSLSLSELSSETFPLRPVVPHSIEDDISLKILQYCDSSTLEHEALRGKASELSWGSLAWLLCSHFAKTDGARNDSALSAYFSQFLAECVVEPLVAGGVASLSGESLLSLFLWLSAHPTASRWFHAHSQSEFILKTFFAYLSGNHKGLKVRVLNC